MDALSFKNVTGLGCASIVTAYMFPKEVNLISALGVAAIHLSGDCLFPMLNNKVLDSDYSRAFKYNLNMSTHHLNVSTHHLNVSITQIMKIALSMLFLGSLWKSLGVYTSFTIASNVFYTVYSFTKLIYEELTT